MTHMLFLSHAAHIDSSLLMMCLQTLGRICFRQSTLVNKSASLAGSRVVWEPAAKCSDPV